MVESGSENPTETECAADATVFVVDDDAAVRRSLHRLIRSAGYAVEECASAVEFLDRNAAAAVGCVVLDIRMPRMTGTELFDRMREGGGARPVIFLTGHGDLPTGIDAMKKGAVDFLLKPVDGEVLLRAIREAVRRDLEHHALERRSAAVRACLRTLSPRERQVMALVVRGLANRNIAGSLGITEKTVTAHRRRIMQKTGARSVPELVRLADADAARPQPA